MGILSDMKRGKGRVLGMLEKYRVRVIILGLRTQNHTLHSRVSVAASRGRIRSTGMLSFWRMLNTRSKW